MCTNFIADARRLVGSRTIFSSFFLLHLAGGVCAVNLWYGVRNTCLFLNSFLEFLIPIIIMADAAVEKK